MLTLSEKEAQLRDTVALPTEDDWQLLKEEQNAAIVDEANAILVKVLELCKRGTYSTWGDIARAVYTPLGELEERYEAGLLDSEGRQTVARFFGVNYTPAMYDYLRYADE
jgi:hypothetical protein